MPAELVVVYTAGNLPQAFLLKNLLAEYGVAAQVLDEAIHSLAEDPSNWRAQPRVAVRREDAEFAREVAEGFDAQLRRGAEAVARGEESAPVEAQRWESWMACPQCGEPRPTFCPGCDTRGTDFRLAEFVPSSERGQPIQLVADGRETPGEPVHLVCPLCDEVFRPEFHRRCARCGHDFGSGIEIHSSQSDPDEALNLRAATLLGVLLVLSIVVIAILSLAWRRG